MNGIDTVTLVTGLLPSRTGLSFRGQRKLVSLKSELMGARMLVGRVRLIGGAFFYDRTPSLVIGRLGHESGALLN